MCYVFLAIIQQCLGGVFASRRASPCFAGRASPIHLLQGPAVIHQPKSNLPKQALLSLSCTLLCSGRISILLPSFLRTSTVLRLKTDGPVDEEVSQKMSFLVIVPLRVLQVLAALAVLALSAYGTFRARRG